MGREKSEIDTKDNQNRYFQIIYQLNTLRTKAELSAIQAKLKALKIFGNELWYLYKVKNGGDLNALANMILSDNFKGVNKHERKR